MRNLSIIILSLVLTTVVIGNAYYQKKQFFPTVIYITKSNPSMAILYIQAFILVILMGKLMRKVFFGELRPVELEHLMERSWYAVTETCLAFTVFRDDFSPKFVALFTLLLFLKSFHWLAEERVDFMERSPVISMLFHIRIMSLLLVLGALDLNFVSHAYQSTLTKGASVQLVFGFEYAILLTIVLNIIIKYTLHSTDLHRELPWEHKAVFLLYTELIMGFIKVVLYVLFVFIMIRIYTLPLFAFRPMYYTVRAFKKAFNDVIMSRRAIRNMNTLYPDATPEELAAADNVCIICREEMNASVASKKLPCNHIFHTSCLRSWFQRQQTCPTCRLNILRTPINNQQNPLPQQRVPDQQTPQLPQQPPNFPWNRDTANQQSTSNTQNASGNGSTSVPGTSTMPPNAPLPDHVHYFCPPYPHMPFTSNTQNASGNGSTSVPGTSTMPPNAPLPDHVHYFCPPYPHMPFNLAPPMPPFEGLSDEELKKLENQTREGLEARVRCLQNIQTLLDVAVVMMQQYCAAAAVGQQQNVDHQNVSTPQENVHSTSNSNNQTCSSTLQNDSFIKDQKVTEQSSTSSIASPVRLSDSVEPSCSTTNNEIQTLSREQELARQRRLEMFDNTKHQSSG